MTTVKIAILFLSLCVLFGCENGDGIGGTGSPAVGIGGGTADLIITAPNAQTIEHIDGTGGDLIISNGAGDFVTIAPGAINKETIPSFNIPPSEDGIYEVIDSNGDHYLVEVGHDGSFELPLLIKDGDTELVINVPIITTPPEEDVLSQFIKASIDPQVKVSDCCLHAAAMQITVADSEKIPATEPTPDAENSSVKNFANYLHRPRHRVQDENGYIYVIKQEDRDTEQYGRFDNFARLIINNLEPILPAPRLTSTLEEYSSTRRWHQNDPIFSLILPEQVQGKQLHVVNANGENPGRLLVLSDHHVLSYSLFDSAMEPELQLINVMVFDSQIINSSLLGETLHVISHFQPQIPELIKETDSETVAFYTRSNKALIEAADIQNLLPNMQIDDENYSLAEHCFVPDVADKVYQPSLNLVSSIDIYAFTRPISRCIASRVSRAYVSRDNVYFYYRINEQTKIHRLEISDQDAIYRLFTLTNINFPDNGAGWFDEYAGHLRMVGVSDQAYVLQIAALQEAGGMQWISALPNLEHNQPLTTSEGIDALIFSGDSAYLAPLSGKGNTSSVSVIELDLSVPEMPFITGDTTLTILQMLKLGEAKEH